MMIGAISGLQQNHLANALTTLASSMDASTFQFRLAAENISNAQSTANTPGGTPYQRKLATFGPSVDRQTGADVVALKQVSHDHSDFREEYIPNHPAANEKGIVLFPNVDTMVEAVDAQNANIALRTASSLYKLNTDMLRRVHGLIDSAKG